MFSSFHGRLSTLCLSFTMCMCFIILQGGFGGTLSKIDIKIKMAHDGEVNRARIMPQNNVCK